MPRGRPRKRHANIPAHIDQACIPRGLYWDASGRGRWYVIDEVGGVRRKRTVAHRDAKLSDLHAIAETATDPKGSLKYLLSSFHESEKFQKLARGTQRDYEYVRNVLLQMPTRDGGTLGELQASRMGPPLWQRIIDRTAANGTPTKANKILRYMRRVYRWGIPRGLCTNNPIRGLEPATERKRRRLPSPEIHSALVGFARKRGNLPSRSRGSCAPYIWIAMELAYLIRLRGIEVDTLTDAHASEVGIHTNRRKGSRDNVTRWSPRLRTAWDAAIAYRERVMAKHHRPIPLNAEQRYLLVNDQGTPLVKSSLDSAWQRFMKLAIKERIIAPEKRFGLHDLKRRGVTDTPGTRAQKQESSGHKSEQMMEVYDLSVPVVDPTDLG